MPRIVLPDLVTWVDREALLLLHGESLARFGGLEGLRDIGLLESALSRPQNLVSYGMPDLFACAASYAYGIAKNHPFIDGNKRAAFMACGLFLLMNGYELTASPADATLKMLALAGGDMTEDAYADWLRANVRERDSD